jgi:hypothetical protein
MEMAFVSRWPAKEPHDPLAVEADLDGRLQVVRGREVLGAPRVDGDDLVLRVQGANGAADLRFLRRTRLRLSETGPRAAPDLEKYAAALEVGRAVEVLGVVEEGGFRPVAFWCSARYDEQRRHGSRKPDPEFVSVLASAAKDERIAAAVLRAAGHDPQGPVTVETRPYVVVISASLGGRPLNADLECRRCSTRFEVKGRPNDSKLRFSHSKGRTFVEENRRQDFHIFVERHRRIRFFSNADVMDGWSLAASARDTVDTWVDFSAGWGAAHERSVPACPPHHDGCSDRGRVP